MDYINWFFYINSKKIYLGLAVTPVTTIASLAVLLLSTTCSFVLVLSVSLQYISSATQVNSTERGYLGHK